MVVGKRPERMRYQCEEIRMTNKPHGGKLINRLTGKLPDCSSVLDISTQNALDLARIADGSYSPLTGFMNSDELRSVTENMELPGGEIWPMPIILQVNGSYSFSAGDRIALRYNGEKVGCIDVSEVFNADMKQVLLKTYGTIDPAHPNVNQTVRQGRRIIGGNILALKKEETAESTGPEAIRKVFRERKWQTIAAYQTRNPPHMAHEYIQRLAMELTDGLFINPVVGELKTDDFSQDDIMGAYRLFVSKYYPDNKVVLSPLMISMRYAGPKAALFLAIVRKNYGCTHFIIGRDMAGAGSFYSPYAAQEMLEKFDIGLQVLKIREVFFCRKCKCMATENTCGHTTSNRENMSMTEIRNRIKSGISVPEAMMRPDITELLSSRDSNQPFVEM
jgi:sulfate adenylyltransferase